MSSIVSLARDFARALDPTLIARDLGIDHLDDWQARLIADPPKRALICCGRQVGKSTAAAVCALNTAIYQAPATIVLISPSQRQSVELYRTLHEMWRASPRPPRGAVRDAVPPRAGQRLPDHFPARQRAHGARYSRGQPDRDRRGGPHR